MKVLGTWFERGSRTRVSWHNSLSITPPLCRVVPTWACRHLET